MLEIDNDRFSLHYLEYLKSDAEDLESLESKKLHERIKDAKNGHDKYYRTIRVSASYWNGCKRELFIGVNYSNSLIERTGDCSSMSSDKFSARTNSFGVREKFYTQYADDKHLEKVTTFSERQTQ